MSGMSRGLLGTSGVLPILGRVAERFCSQTLWKRAHEMLQCTESVQIPIKLSTKI